MNAPEIAAPNVTLACGDCAGEILVAGGAYAAVAEIPIGAQCAVHPVGHPPMVATNAVIPKAGWSRPAPFELPEEPLELSGGRTAMGPLTEIATRLLVAWSSGEGGRANVVDDGTIAAAVHTARTVLRMTQGA